MTQCRLLCSLKHRSVPTTALFMKVENLIIPAFLASTTEGFAPASCAVRERGNHQIAALQSVATRLFSAGRAASRPRHHQGRASRKRARAYGLSSADGNELTPDGTASGGGDRRSERTQLPSRLQEAVLRLDREPDLCAKAKRLVQLGDAFASSDAAVLPSLDEQNWRSQKVPGCVSEVYIAVSILGSTVSIRGTADARVSRGVLAMLVTGLDGERVDTVLSISAEPIASAVGLKLGLTNSRINGLGSALRIIQNLVRGHLDRAPGMHAHGEIPRLTVDEPLPRAHSIGRGNAAGVAGVSNWRPLPGAEDEVAMLLSGGVDSSVALRLLQDQGYRVRAFYLKIWLEDELSHLGKCPWEEDLTYATAVCEQAGVPLEVIPLQREYWEQVVSYTVREAREGRTPNPDVMCNSRIKFGMFYDYVGRHFRHVATGHYARVECCEPSGASADGVAVHGGKREASGSVDAGVGSVRLLLSPDGVKDQTYFLCALTQAQLRKALFPVGAYTKEQIRELADSYDLPTKGRKDSQGICFLGKLKFDDFLRHYLGDAPGTVVDRETGNAIGEHRGLWFHTIGQRKGVGPGLKAGYVNLGPWYVSGKDLTGNVLEVTNDRDSIVGPRQNFQVEELRWITGHMPDDLTRQGFMHLKVKTRHGPQMKRCELQLARRPVEEKAAGSHVNERGNKCMTEASTRGYVHLETKDSALAPGQYAAFYVGQECVGSGVIAEAELADDAGETAFSTSRTVDPLDADDAVAVSREAFVA